LWERVPKAGEGKAGASFFGLTEISGVDFP
jgi:hypothetical protein